MTVEAWRLSSGRLGGMMSSTPGWLQWPSRCEGCDGDARSAPGSVEAAAMTGCETEWFHDGWQTEACGQGWSGESLCVGDDCQGR